MEAPIAAGFAACQRQRRRAWARRMLKTILLSSRAPGAELCTGAPACPGPTPRAPASARAHGPRSAREHRCAGLRAHGPLCETLGCISSGAGAAIPAPPKAIL